MKLFSVPNLFSLGNLLCGCIATLNVIEGNLYIAAALVGIASVLDFFDGFMARALKQGSPMGKELDSLADMVTFGVVPGMVMFQLIRYDAYVHPCIDPTIGKYIPYTGFIVPLFSGLRLAKFNIDTRQSETFIGLPTLANAIFMTGLPFLMNLDPGELKAACSYSMVHEIPKWCIMTGTKNWLYNFLHAPVVLAGITALLSFLLISEIPMFSFKVKHVKWKGNEVRYIFLLLSLGLAIGFQAAAISMIIVLYILVSIITSLVKRSEKVDFR